MIVSLLCLPLVGGQDSMEDRADRKCMPSSITIWEERKGEVRHRVTLPSFHLHWVLACGQRHSTVPNNKHPHHPKPHCPSYYWLAWLSGVMFAESVWSPQRGHYNSVSVKMPTKVFSHPGHSEGECVCVDNGDRYWSERLHWSSKRDAFSVCTFLQVAHTQTAPPQVRWLRSESLTLRLKCTCFSCYHGTSAQQQRSPRIERAVQQ